MKDRTPRWPVPRDGLPWCACGKQQYYYPTGKQRKSSNDRFGRVREEKIAITLKNAN
jgi:hypothetical protein